MKLLNVHMLIKQNSLSLPRGLTLVTFGKLQIVFSTKVKSVILVGTRDSNIDD